MSTRIFPNHPQREVHDAFILKRYNATEYQDLQFVNLPSSLKLDVATRKKVRSHVARDFRRRVRVPNSLGVNVNIHGHVTRDRAPGQKHRFRIKPQGLEQTRNQPKIIVPRKASTVCSDGSLSICNTVRTGDDTEDRKGVETQLSPSSPAPVSINDNNPSVTVDNLYDPLLPWDGPVVEFNSAAARSKYQTPKRGTEHLEASQRVEEPPPGYSNLLMQKSHLSSTVSGSLEPFNCLPIDNSCRTQTLMHHFHLRIMASPLMMNPRKEWFSLAIQDHALFHVALSHAAGNLGLLTQKGDSIESLSHRLEAIKIINERLDDLSCGIGDGTIGAVASMASYEATNGTIEGILTHMNGLEQMVRMRGGLREGGFSAPLRRLIAWADLNAANALSTSPRFPPLSDCRLQANQFVIDPIAFQFCNTPAPIPTAITTTSPSPFPSTQNPDLAILNPRLATSFLTLRGLSRLHNISGPKAVIRMDHTCYSDMAYASQHDLMLLAAEFSSQPASLERACCLTALIYLECCIREIHPRSRIIKSLVLSLKAALMPLEGVLGMVQGVKRVVCMARLIFWCVVVAAAASVEMAEHAWFVQQVGAMCTFLGVRGWEGARGVMRCILWPEKETELTRSLVWAEVEARGWEGSFEARLV